MRTGMRHASGDHGGFTLIEIVITVTIVAIAAGILIPFMVSVRGSVQPLLMQQATKLAEERLEQLTGDRRNQLTPRGFTFATTPGNYAPEIPVFGFPNFNRSIAIACVTPPDLDAGGTIPSPSCSRADGQTDLARVTVTVDHVGGNRVSLIGFFRNY